MPHRIIGTEKCTHLNKKTGLQDCNKLGRFNQKPVISWNNQRKLDKNKKRQYAEFIHNDGTSHILGRFNDYRLNQMKGEPSEYLFKRVITLARVFHDSSNFFYKIAEASLKWNPLEKQVLLDAFRQGNLEPIIKKYNQYEHDRRRKIYDDSQDVNKEGYRYYGTLRSQVDDDYIHRNAKNLFNLSLLGLSREDLELQISKLTEEESIKVYERYCELVDAFQKFLYDRKELFEEVARKKGYKLPEPKRLIS